MAWVIEKCPVMLVNVTCPVDRPKNPLLQLAVLIERKSCHESAWVCQDHGLGGLLSGIKDHLAHYNDTVDLHVI